MSPADKKNPILILQGKPVLVQDTNGGKHRGTVTEIHTDSLVLEVENGFYPNGKMPVVLMLHGIVSITEEIPEEPKTSYIEAAKLAEARRNKG